MTAEQQTAQIIADHQIGQSMFTAGTWFCECANVRDGKEIAVGVTREEAEHINAAHIAQELAAAGLIPTRQEWGVPNSSGTMIVGNTRDAILHYEQTYNRPVSTRHVTDWTPE